MLKQIALIALMTLALPALGEEIFETCTLDGSLELGRPTQIFCSGDMKVNDGAEIVTNGHGLQIVALGRMAFGSSDGVGLNIVARAKDAGKVFVYARTASGTLNIDNKAQNLGGDVEIEFGSSFRYNQTVDAGKAAAVRTVINGQELQL